MNGPRVILTNRTKTDWCKKYEISNMFQNNKQSLKVLGIFTELIQIILWMENETITGIREKTASPQTCYFQDVDLTIKMSEKLQDGSTAFFGPRLFHFCNYLPKCCPTVGSIVPPIVALPRIRGARAIQETTTFLASPMGCILKKTHQIRR